MRVARDRRLYAVLRATRNRSVRAVKRLQRTAPSASIHASAHVSRDLEAGAFAFIGPQCWIGPRTHIGAYSMLAPRVAVVGDDHVSNVAGVPIQFTGRPEQHDTRIGRDVWIGYGAIISRGVTIGDGAIVGAGSVVTRDVPEYEVWVGVPARRLRARFSDEDRERHRIRLDAGEFSIAFAEPQESP